MTDHANPFYRLAPFIQDFIYRQNWAELRVIQADTTRAVFDSDQHILVTSGTASGKTEAAFLPVLTDLYNRPSRTIGVLYIGPLKALINNQFERLQDLLSEAHIPVQSWHGDVDRGRKLLFLQQAQGVLQITPESLEAILMRHHADLGRLFGDLRYVIIDEVHAFINSDRGRQVMCQLGRLERYQTVKPRRIGLSATLGDPQQAMRWLAGNTGRETVLVNDLSGKRTIELGLLHFVGLGRNFAAQQDYAIEADDTELIAALNDQFAQNRLLFTHMYGQTKGKKSIVFTNTRRDAERVIGYMRDIAQYEGTPDIYYVHHGSVSAPLREAAEAAMQADSQPACTSATLTLELGIDIGQLDQTLQLSAPLTVSSFVQRLGRSGRRGNPARMLFYHEEPPIDERTALGSQIPWDMLQTIAIVQLYLEDKWLEPVTTPKLPFSLLYHQTLSVLTAHTELSPAELAERILTLPPFAEVSQPHYRILLRHLLETRHIEQTEDGHLIVGLAAERIVNHYRFFATFADEVEYSVRDGSREIGTLQAVPAVGDRIGLAGFTWKVLAVDSEKRTIKVERVAGTADTSWVGGMGRIHDRVVARIRQVLTETVDYGYLQTDALKRLDQARELAADYRFGRRSLIPLGGDSLLLLPWRGSLVSNTLQLLLRRYNVPVKFEYSPFFFQIGGFAEPTEFARLCHYILADPPNSAQLAEQVPPLTLQAAKFDPYIPEILLREAYAVDSVDLSGALAVIANWAAESERG
jgi:ATP-dependent Lhr-like helicase